MEDEQQNIKALDTYYEVAKKEYDDSHKYYDAIDNKISIFMVASVAVPTLLLSWAKIRVGFTFPFIFDCLGFVALIGVLVFIVLALRVRKARFGANYDEFQKACTTYNDRAMREAVADMWLKAAKENNIIAEDKASQLRNVQWLFLVEMLLFLVAAIGFFGGCSF